MAEVICLDSGPLGLLCKSSRGRPLVMQILAWLRAHLDAGSRVYLPEIVDYEVRRELAA